MTKPKRTNDPEATRKRILSCAVESFSRTGFAGTSLEDVAQVAGVRKSLVAYHYGDKGGLWRAAAEDAVQPLIELATALAEAKAEPDIEKLLRTRFKVLGGNPKMQRLLLWQSLEHVPLPSRPAELIPKVLQVFAGFLRAEPEKTRRMFLVLICAMDGWFLHRETLGALFADGNDPEARDEAFLSYLIQIARDEAVILREA